MKKRTNYLLMMCWMIAAFSAISCSKDIIEEEDIFNGFILNANSTANEKFLTDWENVQVVKINSTNRIDSTATPWNSKKSVSVLPDQICSDVKKADGWEMVFSSLGDQTVKDANYFALYNKHLGIMRVFCFVSDASGIGSELSFGVKLGSSRLKTPFYHTLAYGIPASHSQVATNIPIASPSADSFYAYYSPYTITGNHAPTRGWYAFDVDMSAYNSSPEKFLDNKDEHVTIYCSTQNNAKIKLSGTLDASIKGEYTSASLAQNASSGSGIGSTLNMLGQLMGDVQTFSLANLEAVLCGEPWNLYSCYAGVVFQGAACLANYINKPYTTDEIEEIPGKIEMNLTGTIDLSGYATSLVANNVPALKLSAPIMKQEGSHFGQGVWSLEDDPVIYISGNRFMGNGSRINFVVGKDGQYNSSRLDYDELRLMTFLDPSSIKVNLNPNLFGKNDTVTIEAYYGVFPDEKPGSTALYQSLMKMDKREPICLVNHEKYKEGDIYRSTNHTNAMSYIRCPKENFIKSDATDKEKKSYTTVAQADGKYSYYGQTLSGGTGKGKQYVLEPQIFLPLANSNTLCDGVIPDLIVTVNVTVKGNGHLYNYTRNFVPKIRVVKDDKEYKTVKDRLNEYIASDKSKGFSDYVNNMSSGDNKIPVKFSNATKRFQRIIDLIDLITK